MEKADVVVVGAGPSGSAAAYFLSKQGVDVALIDKNSFPREKTCGDGLGPRTIQMLDKMGLGGWLMANKYYRCDRVRLISNSGTCCESKIPAQDTQHPYFYIASRTELDQKLLDTAADVGTKVYTSCKALAPVKSGGKVVGVKALYNKEEVEIPCKVVICADGTNGTFAKHTGMEIAKPYAFAIRAYYSNVKGLDDCINIYLDKRFPEGYAWIFPTTETTANIGLGVSSSTIKNGANIKQLLDWFLQEKGTEPVDLSGITAVSDIKGAHLKMGYGKHVVVADGILLVGDAAALINPLTGEGIAYALESGEQAAVVVKRALDKDDVSADTLKTYQDHLNKHLFTDHKFYEMIRQSLSRERLSDRLLRKGIKHPDFAAQFVSVMMSTAKPSSLFTPKMLMRYLV